MAPSKSARASKNVSRAPSGVSTPVVIEAQVPVTTVIGLNFGQSFSSISIINKVRCKFDVVEGIEAEKAEGLC